MKISVDEALKKGVDAHRAGDLQGAERFYSAILEADPDHSDANHNMGVLAVGVGKMREALPFFKKATLINPSIHQYWLSYIESLNKLGDSKKAWHELGKAKGYDLPQQLIDKMEAIISKQKLCINSELLLLRDSGRFSDAISLAQKLLVKDKQDPEILSFIAQCHILNNDLENGELFLKKATEVDSSISSISWNKARLFLKKKEFSEALETALKTKSHLSKKDESLAILGACYFANGNYKAANETIEKALSINPDNAEALANRGMILLKNGNNAEALESLILAFKQKPHLRQIWEILITLLSQLKRYDEAIKISKEIIQIDSQNAKVYAYIGECYTKLNENTKALTFFGKAVDIDPNYAEAHYNKGVCLNSLSEPLKAIGCYKKAISLKNDYADAFYNLGISYFETGDLENSYHKYTKALLANPNHTNAKNNWIALLSWYDPPPDEHSNKYISRHLKLRKLKLPSNEKGKLKDTTVEKIINNIFNNVRNLELCITKSQAFRSGKVEMDCERHLSIFKQHYAIPKFCFTCYKVQIEPENVYDLIKLYLIFDTLYLGKDRTRKCMIELRNEVLGFYKGLIYCTSLEDAQIVLNLITPIIQEKISKSLTAKIKHGCSEYAIKYPSFNNINLMGPQEMVYNPKWQKIEDDYDMSHPAKFRTIKDRKLTGINLEDALIIQNWISYGIGIGDKKAQQLKEISQIADIFVSAGKDRLQEHQFDNLK